MVFFPKDEKCEKRETFVFVLISLNILAVKYPNVFDTNICPWDLSNFAKRPLIASLTVLYSCRFDMSM
jgi:hypothetical protein